MKALPVEAIRLEFPNQWILIEVAEARDGAPFKGVVLKASHRRQEIVDEIGKNKGKKLFFFFSGITASPNTAFAL